MIARVLALAVLGVAVWLSLTPKPPMIEGLPQNSDLVAHFLMHAGAAGALWLAWPPGRVLAAVIVALAVGLELGQLAVTGRVFAVSDMVANLIGAGVGMLGAALLRRHALRVAAKRS